MDGWNTFSFPVGAFGPIFRCEGLLVSGRVMPPATLPATDRYKAKLPRIDPDTVSAVMARGDGEKLGDNVRFGKS